METIWKHQVRGEGGKADELFFTQVTMEPSHYFFRREREDGARRVRYPKPTDGTPKRGAYNT